ADDWTLEAAEPICADDTVSEDSVLDLLGHLVDMSLVGVNQAGPVSRYRLLEIVREYAHEKLEASGELAMLQTRHLRWYVALSEPAESAPDHADAAAWLNRLDSELANVRAALDWSVASRDIEAGLRLAGALRWFWDLRGHAREGREHLAWLV